MFIVGMELDTRLLRKQAFEALIISHASILIPFSLGVGLIDVFISLLRKYANRFFFICIIHGHCNEHYGFPGAGKDYT